MSLSLPPGERPEPTARPPSPSYFCIVFSACSCSLSAYSVIQTACSSMTLCLWSCSWFHKDPLRAYLMREHMRQSPWTAKLGRCCRLLRLEGAELPGQRGHEEPLARRPLLPRPCAPEVDEEVSLRPRWASPEPTAWERGGLPPAYRSRGRKTSAGWPNAGCSARRKWKKERPAGQLSLTRPPQGGITRRRHHRTCLKNTLIWGHWLR